MRLRVEDEFLIWREEDDEPRGHLCEPRITRVSTGGILLSFRTGSLRHSPDGSPRLLSSSDGGRTWADYGHPLDGLLPGRPGWDYRAAALTQLGSGAVLLCTVGLDRSSSERPPWLVYNPDPAAYQGMIPIRNLLSRSEDGGRTWSPVWPMTGLPVRNSSVQMLVTLPDGDVLCPLETFKEFDEPGPWRYRVDMIRSHDEGRTWGESAPAHVSDPEGDPRWLQCWDPRIAVLADGRLVQFYYAFLNGTGGEDPVHVGWSSDHGRTWVLPRPTSVRGQAMFPIPQPAGGVIGFTQRRHEPQCMVATYSADGGATFDPGAEVAVYEHHRPSGAGFSQGADPVGYMNDMMHFTFGHPAGVALDDGRTLVVWYAGHETRTEVRGAILRLD